MNRFIRYQWLSVDNDSFFSNPSQCKKNRRPVKNMTKNISNNNPTKLRSRYDFYNYSGFSRKYSFCFCCNKLRRSSFFLELKEKTNFLRKTSTKRIDYDKQFESNCRNTSCHSLSVANLKQPTSGINCTTRTDSLLLANHIQFIQPFHWSMAKRLLLRLNYTKSIQDK